MTNAVCKPSIQRREITRESVFAESYSGYRACLIEATVACYTRGVETCVLARYDVLV